MLGGTDIWSLPRRSLARTSEISFAGAMADALGLLPGFNEAAFGDHLVFYLLLCTLGSMIYDLFEIVTRPNPEPSPCVDDAPELPFDGEK